MRYYSPETVISPKEYLEIIEIIFDGGEDSYSIAKIRWEDVECYAMRWNVARREWDDPEKINENKICVDMPSSHGYPVWFVLPNDILNHKFLTKNKKEGK